MKEIKLTIDGREVKLTKEQIKALGIDVDDGCVCDKVGIGEAYYYIDGFGEVGYNHYVGDDIDEDYYTIGNYYRSESYAQQITLHQQLNNLLRRYSEQHGGDAEWDGGCHYFICRDTYNRKIYVNSCNVAKTFGAVYFNSREVANAAVEEVVKPFLDEHPDFVW